MCTDRESNKVAAATVLEFGLALNVVSWGRGKKAYLETGGMRQNMSKTWSDMLKAVMFFNRSFAGGTAL